MQIVPIQFYQVTAAAIPTLMIAVIIGAKHGQVLEATPDFFKGFKTVVLPAFAVLMVFVVAWGEGLSLVGVIFNGARVEWAEFILGVIAAIFFVLAIEFIDPLTKALSTVGTTLMFAVLGIGFLIGLLIARNWLEKFLPFNSH